MTAKSGLPSAASHFNTLIFTLCLSVLVQACSGANPAPGSNPAARPIDTGIAGGESDTQAAIQQATGVDSALKGRTRLI